MVFDVHVTTKYFFWAIMGWSFTSTLKDGYLHEPRAIGTILFIIYLFVSGTALYEQLGYGEYQAMQTWYYVIVCELMFFTTVYVSRAAGKTSRLLLSCICFKDNRKKKLLRITNCIVTSLFVINTATILYEMITYRSIWNISHNKQVCFALLLVIWAFTDVAANDDSIFPNISALVGMVYYISFLFSNKIISLSSIDADILINELWPLAAYLIIFIISRKIGRKLW